ncbi:hypothetical protein ACJZ2D_010456 [Fusarium nematophilum]
MTIKQHDHGTQNASPPEEAAADAEGVRALPRRDEDARMADQPGGDTAAGVCGQGVAFEGAGGHSRGDGLRHRHAQRQLGGRRRERLLSIHAPARNLEEGPARPVLAGAVRGRHHHDVGVDYQPCRWGRQQQERGAQEAGDVGDDGAVGAYSGSRMEVDLCSLGVCGLLWGGEEGG